MASLINSVVKKAGKNLAKDVGKKLVDKLPGKAREIASKFLRQQLENQSITGRQKIRPIRASASVSQDWRCRLRWPDAESMYADGVFQYLPGGNTIIWPYTPQFTINYQASYEMIKTLQTNYSTPAYQSSDVSSISIAGTFTATTVAEANYLYAVLHFLKSSTKGHNFEGDATRVGRPPPVLKLTYLGEGGVKDMPVVVQQLNLDYPVDVDYVRTDMINDSANITPSESTGVAIPPSMVPAEMSVTVTLVPAYARSDLISKDYSTTKFINGELIGKGFF